MRREKIILIKDNPASRDFDKKFIITEMSAWEAEKLAHQLIGVLAKAQNYPEEVLEMGCRGLATLGPAVFTLLPANEAEVLTDRLFNSLKISIIGPSGVEVVRRVTPEDFEEWETILLLKDEIFNLNFNFLKKDAK